VISQGHKERLVADGLRIHVTPAVADQPPLPWQQALQAQLVERRQDHPLGQVAGRAEQHEDRRRQIVVVVFLRRHACQPT